MTHALTSRPQVAGAGRALAERLRLTVVGDEGHDLIVGCIACQSSDAGRVHVDSGIYHCFSCGKDLSAFDLTKIVLGHDAAIQAMIDAGLFEPERPRGAGREGSNGNGRPAGDNGHAVALPGETIIHTIARLKGVTAAGLRAYGAREDFHILRIPEYGADGRACSEFWLSQSETKGRNAAGKPAGMFFPGRRPKPGEEWCIVEGCKDGAALHDLGLLAAGLPCNRMNPKFAPLFTGVNVVVIPDADKPGIEGARKTARVLKGVAASVRIASLPTEITDSHGGDVRDVLHDFGERGPEAIRRCIENAKPPEAFGAAGREEGPAEPPRFIEVIDCRQFLALDLRTEYLIHGVLAAGQPTIIGGRSKVLKTSVAIDMAVSLGSGSPFLGKFLAHRVPVGFWSGESGAATIRETALRIAESKGVSLADCSIWWSFDLPRLSQTDHLDALRSIIAEKGLRVAVLDPLYLCLLSGDMASGAGNLYAMGAVLQPLSRLGQETGCTLVLLHHFRKTGLLDDSEPAGLEELAMSGVAEWARQWLLLQRRQPYQSDGRHELFLRCGGSAGHGSLWALNIDEGALDPVAEALATRHWQVEVKPVADARAEAKAERANRKAQAQEVAEDDHRRRVIESLRQFPDGATNRTLRETAGLNSQNCGRALQTLLRQGRLAPCQITNARGTYDGFRLTEK